MSFVDIRMEFDKLTNEGFILEKFIGDFKRYLFDKDCPLVRSKKTNTETLLELHKFDRFLLAAYPNLKYLADIKPAHIEFYKNFCKESFGNNNKTINIKIRAIRYFLAFLKNEKHVVKENAALDVPYLPIDEAKHPLNVPNSNLRIILGLLQQNFGLREVCITKMLAYLGFRLNEIFDISISSINMKEKELYVKRASGYITYRIPDVLYSDLKEYIMIRSQLPNSDSCNSLFLSNTGNPYPIREYQRIFKLTVIEADFKVPFTPRNVRATFAYRMAENIKEENLKILLDQNKVKHYYVEDITSNPVITESK